MYRHDGSKATSGARREEQGNNRAARVCEARRSRPLCVLRGQPINNNRQRRDQRGQVSAHTARAGRGPAEEGRVQGVLRQPAAAPPLRARRAAEKAGKLLINARRGRDAAPLGFLTTVKCSRRSRKSRGSRPLLRRPRSSSLLVRTCVWPGVKRMKQHMQKKEARGGTASRGCPHCKQWLRTSC